MCDFVMTGQLMPHEELAKDFFVNKTVYDLLTNEYDEIIELIACFIDGCAQVLVNNQFVFQNNVDSEEVREKLVFQTSLIIKPLIEANEVSIVSILMHPGKNCFIFQVVFDNTNKTAVPRGFMQPFIIKNIS